MIVGDPTKIAYTSTTHQIQTGHMMSDTLSLPRAEIDRVFPCPQCGDLSDPALRIISEGDRHTYYLRCRLCGHGWETVTRWPLPPRAVTSPAADAQPHHKSGWKIIKTPD